MIHTVLAQCAWAHFHTLLYQVESHTEEEALRAVANDLYENDYLVENEGSEEDDLIPQNQWVEGILEQSEAMVQLEDIVRVDDWVLKIIPQIQVI